jgi:uncharacterized membrane protein YidH (DUF202 family)
MFTSRYLIDSIYTVIFLIALAVVIQDVWSELRRRDRVSVSSAPTIRWRTGIAIMTLAWLPIVIAIISGGF